jgi:hypothetical protein
LDWTSRGRRRRNDYCCRSQLFRNACAGAGVRHPRTRSYTPRTDGKAEPFLQRVMGESAGGRAFGVSRERAAAVPAGCASPTRTGHMVLSPDKRDQPARHEQTAWR